MGSAKEAGMGGYGRCSLTLARHLQPHGNATAGLWFQPGKPLVAIYLAHEGLQPHEGAKEHRELAVLDAPLGDGDNVRAAAQTANKRGLELAELAHGAQVLRGHAGRGLGEDVALPERLHMCDPRAALAPERDALRREGVRCQARAQGTGACDALAARRAQDDERSAVIDC